MGIALIAAIAMSYIFEGGTRLASASPRQERIEKKNYRMLGN
jgi:hypothetical protein